MTPDPKRRLLAAALVVSAVAAVVFRVAGEGGVVHEALILTAVFIAALVSSVAGFAFSAIAAVMLVHMYDNPAEMVRLLLVCSISSQLYCGCVFLRSIRWREVAGYLAGGLLTVPIGVLLLQEVRPQVYALGLGAFLVAYSAYSLARPFTLRVPDSTAMRMSVGALGGVMGGLAALPGAIVVMWCVARGMDKNAQRALCQAYILVMQLAALVCLQLIDHRQMDGLLELWSFVPVVVLAALIGCSVFARVSTAEFKMIVLTILGFSGSLLMVKGW